MSGEVIQRLENSYRDPAGFMFRHEDGLFRAVCTPGMEDYSRLMSTGLYDRLVGQGRLVRHTEVELAAFSAPEVRKILCPERVPFLSYPFEWPFHALKDAALTTLDVALEAMAAGMMLKDASSYNVQFMQGRPVLIDSLSLGCYREGSPWSGYRQFCEQFLGPLAVMALGDENLHGAMRGYPSGLPLEVADRMLGRRVWRSFGALVHIHWQAKVQRRAAAGGREENAGGRGLSEQSVRGLLLSLRSLIGRLEPRRSGQGWGRYYSECRLGEAYESVKETLVKEFLQQARPASVWDLGANTGRFSRIAAELGSRVVALDNDPRVVDALYLEGKGKAPAAVLPLVVDIAEPTPGLGWMNTDSLSLLERGPADCCLALALIHHLRLSRNIPFSHIGAMLAGLATWLIVEFVPLDDPNARLLLRGREEVFADYSRESFENAFRKFFSISATRAVGPTGRLLYLMRKT